MTDDSRRFKRLRTEFKSIFGRDGAPAGSTPTPGSDAPTPMATEQTSVCPPPPAQQLRKSDAISSSKLGDWTSLKACLESLGHVSSMSGLGPLERVIEGLADCVGIYEHAAQGRRAYTELRMELEDIFQELHQYITLSPTVASSVSDICVLLQNEIDYVKGQQVRSKKRRLAEAEQDEDNILECYKRMRNHLQGLSRKMGVSTLAIVEKHAMDDRLNKLAPALSARYNSGSALKLKRGPCTKGTRVKVLSDMYQWITGENTGNIYWMSGMAGTGKTTIAYSLCERLDMGPGRILGASFFCSRSLPECRDVGKIIPSIAYQLAQRSQAFCYVLSEIVKLRQEALDDAPSMQFETLLVKPLLDPKVKAGLPAGVVVVIDALDECEDMTSTRQILDALSTKSKGLPIKFVVSSRPETAIRDQMQRNGSWVDARVVLHELDSGEVQTDIRTYLKAELAPVDPSESDINKLVDQAGVLFIYAATVVRYLGRDNFQRNSRARLRAMLDTSRQQSKAQTKDIDQLYQLILEAAMNDDELENSEREDIKLILKTVVCAKAPLTVAALNALLKLGDVERVSAALRPLWSVLHVVGREMTVTTLHASFPDYLTDSERSGNSMWHCDLAVHHHILAQQCFECIRDARPQFNICQLESSYLNDNEVVDLDERVEKLIPVELRYACRYWYAHLYASDSSASSGLLLLLEHFLSNNLLLWLEVMNLTQNISTTPEKVTTVRRWAMRHGATQELIDLMQDAWRFATTVVSSPVGQSTPHIYVSMLPFLPSHSPIRKHYYQRMHGMIGVEGTARNRKKKLLGGWSLVPSSCAAFSPDSTLVAITPRSDLKVISLVDLPSGRTVQHMHMSHAPISFRDDMSYGDIDMVTSLAFSPDGSCVASGMLDGCIWTWDVRSGQPTLGPLRGHKGTISCLVFSHSGLFIISVDEYGTILMWDATTGKPTGAPPLSHTGAVWTMAVSLDDSKLVSGSSDQTVRVWDMQTGRLVFDPITIHAEDTEGIWSIAISANGNLVVIGSSDSTLRVWNVQTGQAEAGPFFLPSSASSVAISPDNAHISAGLGDGTIQTWDLMTGAAVSGQLRAHSKWVSMLMYSRDGARIISYSSHDGSLSVFDAQGVTATDDTLPADLESILSIDISPDGRHIVSGSDRNTLRIWDRMNGEIIHGPLVGHTKRVCFVRYSPDGSRILSCSDDHTLRQWNARNGGSIQADHPIVAPSNTQPSDIAKFTCATYSPNGCYIATGSNGLGVCVWGSDHDERVPGFTKSFILSIEFTADGMTLIAGCEDGAVRVWNARTGQLVSGPSIVPIFFFSVSAFAISADRLYNAVGYYMGRNGCGGPDLYQRTTQTGNSGSISLKGHTSYVCSVHFSSNGTRIVSGSADKTVHIWNANNGNSIFGPLTGHTLTVNSVAYSPDGTYVASASDDTTIRIWDTNTQLDSSQFVSWVLQKDGWVVDASDQSRRLIWVPLEFHSSLILPRNTMVLSCDGYMRLNFDGALLGEEWIKCWMGK